MESIFSFIPPSGTSLEGGGGRSLLPFFQKLEKSALIFKKHAMIVVIYGLNFSFKKKSF